MSVQATESAGGRAVGKSVSEVNTPQSRLPIDIDGNAKYKRIIQKETGRYGM